MKGGKNLQLTNLLIVTRLSVILDLDVRRVSLWFRCGTKFCGFGSRSRRNALSL
jgi:hypothetical protein